MFTSVFGSQCNAGAANVWGLRGAGPAVNEKADSWCTRRKPTDCVCPPHLQKKKVAMRRLRLKSAFQNIKIDFITLRQERPRLLRVLETPWNIVSCLVCNSLSHWTGHSQQITEICFVILRRHSKLYTQTENWCNCKKRTFRKMSALKKNEGIKIQKINPRIKKGNFIQMIGLNNKKKYIYKK